MQILNTEIIVPEPNKQQLTDIDIKIEKVKTEFLKMKHNEEPFTSEQYLTMSNFLFRVLDKLAILTGPLFELGDEIEDIYKEHYSHAPELGSALYQQCCTKIHKPYDRLKNHVHDLLDDMSELYTKLNKTNPPEMSEADLLYT